MVDLPGVLLIVCICGCVYPRSASYYCVFGSATEAAETTDDKPTAKRSSHHAKTHIDRRTDTETESDVTSSNDHSIFPAARERSRRKSTGRHKERGSNPRERSNSSEDSSSGSRSSQPPQRRRGTREGRRGREKTATTRQDKFRNRDSKHHLLDRPRNSSSSSSSSSDTTDSTSSSNEFSALSERVDGALSAQQVRSDAVATAAAPAVDSAVTTALTGAASGATSTTSTMHPSALQETAAEVLAAAPIAGSEKSHPVAVVASDRTVSQRQSRQLAWWDQLLRFVLHKRSFAATAVRYALPSFAVAAVLFYQLAVLRKLR